jgi:hypothetical protein
MLIYHLSFYPINSKRYLLIDKQHSKHIKNHYHSKTPKTDKRTMNLRDVFLMNIRSFVIQKNLLMNKLEIDIKTLSRTEGDRVKNK